MSFLGAEERLAAIAELIAPCGAPDVLNGFDLCGCGSGAYPCPATRAAWLARGLDPETAARRALAAAGAYDDPPPTRREADQ